MTIREAITILREMQLWRRGEGKYDVDEPTRMPYSPREFGQAIDTAIEKMENVRVMKKIVHYEEESIEY